MKGPAELVVSLCDLCEAEGRLLQEGILRTVRRVVFLSLGLLFGAAALALLLGALYAVLASLLPTPAVLALLGAASAAVAALLLLGARAGAHSGAASVPPGRDDADAAQAAERPGATGPRAERGATEGPAGAHVGASPAPVPSGEKAHDVWEDVAPYGRPAPKRR